MDFTYEELREEKKKNIEIIEACEQSKKDIDTNIKNINSIIDMIKKQGELDEQIEKLKGQMASYDKINSLFDNDSNETKKVLSEKIDRISTLKTLLVLNQNGSESDIEMLERKLKELKKQKSDIEEEQKNAIKVMENILEICKEHIQEFDSEINVQTSKTTDIGNITEQYAKLEDELESFRIFGNFLTKKQQQRIKEIEIEKRQLEDDMINKLPDLRQAIRNKTKETQLDLLFGMAQIQEGKALDRRLTMINSYKKVADETKKYLENIKEIDNKQINNKEIDEQSKDKKKDNKEKKDIVAKDIEQKLNILDNKHNIFNNTYSLKEDESRKKLNTEITTQKLTNDNWNKDEQKEFEFFFGETPNIEKNNDSLQLSVLGETSHKENNKEENELDKTLQISEPSIILSQKIDNSEELKDNQNTVKEKLEETLSQKNDVNNEKSSYESYFNEYINSLDRKYLDNDIQTKQEEIADEAINEYLRELKSNAKELQIDKKIKRKVAKEKKQGRIKRFFINIKNHFNEKKVMELREELEKQEQKGGRTK